jgi:16S rRNA (adenine1518-N6/adenine1519-N6)-dimethyltransferase
LREAGIACAFSHGHAILNDHHGPGTTTGPGHEDIMRDIQRRLEQLGLRPQKRLGQHFMVNPHVLAQLADAAMLAASDAVLEIGAGLGALTAVLAERSHRVVAVEIDSALASALWVDFADAPNVEIVEGDILALPPSDLMGMDADSYKVVANVPYYITSPIVRHLLEASAPPALAALTVQREVADRMAAPPGKMSVLSVSVQVYGRIEVIGRIGKGTFYPPPGVESAIVRITPHPAPLLAQEERERFFRVVRAGFSQRRKQLKNSLSAGLHLPMAQVMDWLAGAEIAPERRAQTLSVAEWLHVTRTAPIE